MENKFPKNVRQIGNVSDTPKIYVEDYVDTFLNQICDKADKEQVGAFLVGKKEVTEGQECLYIFGAICMEFSDDENEIISQENFEKAEQEKKEYFEDGTMIGWMLCRPGVRMVIDTKIFNTHEKYFSEKNTIFILKDNAEVEEQYYCYKYKELMQIGGHYVYYEKNAAMQSYMITARKKIGVTPSEVVEDRAAKDFRSAVREKMEYKEQHQSSKFAYITSALLVLIVLVIGITTVNNFDKMKLVQTSLENLSKSMENGQTEEDTKTTTAAEAKEGAKEVSGTVKKSEEAKVSKEEESQLTDKDYYVVQKGETLAGISKKLYGDTSHVKAICKMNGLSDGNLIYIGQKLLLP